MNQKNNNLGSFTISDQYVKDMSFENPNFLLKYNMKDLKPNVSVNLETSVDKISDNVFEVIMHLDLRSKTTDKDIFMLDLQYAALTNIDCTDVENEMLETLLYVHCPFLMFPFVRNIVADVTRLGGYAPLFLEPIDFAALYLEKRKEITNNEAVKN